MTNWKEYRLSEIVEIRNGKSRPKEEGIIPVYGGNGVLGYSNKFNVEGESVIIGRVGAYCGAVYYEKRPVWISDNALYSKTNQGFNTKYIYYLLRNDNLNKYAGGSSHPLLTQNRLNDLKYIVPDLSTQNEFAEILSSLDDKIELNNQINKNLEALAQALFKQWFVDFEFPNENGQPYKSAGGEMVESELGEIPSGWISGVLSDIIDFNPTEKLPKGKEASYIDMAALPTQGSWPDKPIQRIAGSGIKFKNGDTLFARITPCLENGKTAFIQCLKEDEIAWGSTEFIVLRPKQPWPKGLAYLIARDESFRGYAVQSMIGTSGRQRAQSSHLEKYPFIYPSDKKLIKLLNDLLVSFFEQIKYNSQENESLSEMRDTILPKLISGELEVSQTISEEVM